MHLFHCTDLVPDLVQLPEEEAHHATHVLRLGVGDRIGLLNGKGVRAEAELVEVSRKGCMAQVIKRVEHPRERTALIHIAIAPTKKMDRIEWFVEKAVEIGVDRITLLRTARSERVQVRMDRLERVAVTAMKQSQRTWLPTLDPITSLEDVLKASTFIQRYFGWCEGEHRSFMEVYDPARDGLILIGPEGDFTPAEADRMNARLVQPITIGSARLRTETAALAACTWMSLAQQSKAIGS
ncbi:MAG: 16S rRNA (uracil(1498)-N(3))-methyltransferase [Flavobacteriales bacterium]|nr:16S rRNA (uracil(1498)-N(3))-methyltransferase [Flavobacteriales bacterium]